MAVDFISIDSTVEASPEGLNSSKSKERQEKVRQGKVGVAE